MSLSEEDLGNGWVPEAPEPAAASPGLKSRGTFLPVHHVYNLGFACRAIVEAYGSHVYLVGSCLTRRDYRDVDVRLILPDEEWDRLFPGMQGQEQFDARWSLRVALSGWLEKHSGLPVDFQIQKRSKANDVFGSGGRHPLGLYTARKS